MVPRFNNLRRRPAPAALFAGSLLGLTLTLAGGAAAAPDLVVSGVDLSGVTYTCPESAASGTVQATVENAGDVSTGAGYRVRFFEDRNGNAAYDAGTDLNFGEAVLPPLGAGSQTVASLAVNATVTFAKNLVHAFADSRNVIVEGNEFNNVLDSGTSCGYQPGQGAFDPVFEWVWDASDADPGTNVLMTPSVIDLDGDGVPEVVFGSTASFGGGYVEVGVLRAIHGSNGTEMFTVTDPGLYLNVASSIATGDIDGDGLPEILAVAADAIHLFAFENDGTYKWTSDEIEPCNWGAPAVADMDLDGVPEIVLGRQVLNNDGTLRWTGAGGRAMVVLDSPLALAADVDLDGLPNVVAGYTVYGADGSTLYENAGLMDGANAVANFDGDPEAEIVLVSNGFVWLLEHDTTVKWGPVEMPGAGGGPPTVADYDGDGQPEIGVAGYSTYTVFDGDGTILWSSPTQDGSSFTTGSSVFDFDGDGSAEVIYRDELNLRIYRGLDGAVLYEVPMSSCTWHEYVLVADVDADGNAEIVAVANENCGLGTQHGIYVIGDAADTWVSTRKVWNQYTYHITNVNDDGTIPQFEEVNWLSPPGQPYNNYRQNTLPGAMPLAAPNVTASRLHVDLSGCPDAIGLVARIGNGGANVATAPVGVAFYDGDPNGGGTLLGVANTSVHLLPGQYEDVTLLVAPSLSGTRTICVTADDSGAGAGALSECDEEDNTCCADLVLGPCDPAGLDDGIANGGDGRARVLSVAPNPARAEVALRVSLPAEGPAAISIFDETGRIVRTAALPGAGAGLRTFTWDLRDQGGAPVGAGVYAYRIETAQGARLNGKVIVLR